MVKRKIEGGGDQGDVDEVNIDDWEHRNYKDSWLPSFERLRMKLMSHYKERKYQGNQRHDEDKRNSLPSMVNKIVDNTVKVMLTPAFGLKPKDRGMNLQRIPGSKRTRSSSSNKIMKRNRNVGHVEKSVIGRLTRNAKHPWGNSQGCTQKISKAFSCSQWNEGNQEKTWDMQVLSRHREMQVWSKVQVWAWST